MRIHKVSNLLTPCQPKDSQHPDRRANVEIYVETWLSDEEYKAAKERHELDWQDAAPSPPEPQTPSDILVRTFCDG